MGSLSFVLLLLRAHGAHSESLNLLLGRATFDSHRGRLAVSYNLMGIATSEVAKGLGLEKGRGVSMKEPPVFTQRYDTMLALLVPFQESHFGVAGLERFLESFV